MRVLRTNELPPERRLLHLHAVLYPPGRGWDALHDWLSDAMDIAEEVGERSLTIVWSGHAQDHVRKGAQGRAIDAAFRAALGFLVDVLVEVEDTYDVACELRVATSEPPIPDERLLPIPYGDTVAALRWD